MRVALPVTCNRPDTSELQRGISREDVCTEPVYTAHTSPVLSNRAAPKKGAQSTPGVCLLWFIQYSVKPGTEIETVQGAAPGPASASPGGPDHKRKELFESIRTKDGSISRAARLWPK